MGKTYNHSNLVQAYFDNEMSAEERVDFEQLIDRDPNLQEEFNLQKDIIEGIRHYRKAELKAHLSTIPTGGIVWTTPLRWAVFGGSAVGLSTLAYFLLFPPLPSSYSEVNLGDGVVLDLTDNSAVPARPMVPHTPEEIAYAPEVEATQPEPKPVQQSTVIAITETRTANNDAVAETPKLEAPTRTIPEYPSQPEFVSEGPEENLPGSIFFEQNREEYNVEVEYMHTRKYDFHYQFYNNKLYLYGDFEGQLYEIIEYNNQDGREFYLFFNQTYHKIDQGQREITELTAIENDALIQQLNRARNHTEK